MPGISGNVHIEDHITIGYVDITILYCVDRYKHQGRVYACLESFMQYLVDMAFSRQGPSPFCYRTVDKKITKNKRFELCGNLGGHGEGF